MPLSLHDVICDFAAAFRHVDETRPIGSSRTRVYRPGIGPLTEEEAIRRALDALSTVLRPGRYANASPQFYSGSRQKCDLVIPGEWAIEFKLIRPFGDNGREAEHWSENIVHPYRGNVSSIGDCFKLIESNFTERKAVAVFGYEHAPPQISLDVAVRSFEVIAHDVHKIQLGRREEKTFGPLIHPVHQVGRLFRWELLLP